jgi:hypothetical protein
MMDPLKNIMSQSAVVDVASSELTEKYSTVLTTRTYSTVRVPVRRIGGSQIGTWIGTCKANKFSSFVVLIVYCDTSLFGCQLRVNSNVSGM